MADHERSAGGGTQEPARGRRAATGSERAGDLPTHAPTTDGERQAGAGTPEPADGRRATDGSERGAAGGRRAAAGDRQGAGGGRRAAAAETRRRLLDAGLRLAERTGLMGLSVNLLVEEAGVSKGTFFHHFGDRSTYVIELHRAFHDRLFERMRAAMREHAPGADRLDAIARTYLDTCLRHRGVRALLLEARADPQIAEEIAARNTASAAEVVDDFTALGWPDPRQTARLWVGLVAEVALLEHAATHRDTALRRALAQLTRR